MAARHSDSRKTIYAALAGNLLIAITKFLAAAVTGSASMLSEGVHSLVDTSNELLLLYGLRRAALPPDDTHPLGHGRELYFWSFIVAVMIFALGAGVSFYEGVTHLLRPEPVKHVLANYGVLALSFLFEGFSWVIALRRFRARKGKLGYFAAFRQSKDPTDFTVLFEDSAALVGIVIAFASIAAADSFNLPALDGVGSLAIGLVLAITAGFLARESKDLLIGEQASPVLARQIVAALDADAAIQRVNGLITAHLAPDQVMVALSAEFHDEATAPVIERSIERLEERLRADHPEITMLFVKPQSADTWRRRAGKPADARS
ncbi:cation diffusion facilitator family transporter [Radicibacter daui]|uniref:cation diffusion facilitator family transporter n=1 Tax=Radicibacter daui TaxID=3064829 RepID=UPI004046BE9B